MAIFGDHDSEDSSFLPWLHSLWAPRWTIRVGRTASSAMDRLAKAKGCYLCHAEKPGKTEQESLLPFAPSWVDIARKYRGQKDAEQRLVEVVLQGSWAKPDQRHWKGKVSDVGCLRTFLRLTKMMRGSSCVGFFPFRSSNPPDAVEAGEARQHSEDFDRAGEAEQLLTHIK